MNKVQMKGFIANVSMKMGPSNDLVKQVKLDVHGDLATLQELMEQPLLISFEPQQLTIGEAPPERHVGRRKPVAAE